MERSEQRVVVYDGDCGLCRAAVGFLAVRDRKRRLQFLPSQSQAGREALRSRGMSGVEAHTVVLIDRQGVWVKSEALLHAAAALGGIWKTALLGKLIPGRIRDFMYDVVARNRYLLSGRNTRCAVDPDVSADDPHRASAEKGPGTSDADV